MNPSVLYPALIYKSKNNNIFVSICVFSRFDLPFTLKSLEFGNGNAVFTLTVDAKTELFDELVPL